MSKARQLADIPQSQYAFRNKIINGNFDIWQRGTSTVLSGSSSVVGGYGTVDRFYYAISGGSTANTAAGVNLSQQAFTLGQTVVPNNPVYFARLQATTLPTQSGTGSVIYSSHRVEYVKTLSGKTATLSVWLKADTTRTGAITIRQNFGSGGSPSPINLVFQSVLNLTATWQKFVFTFNVPSISGKTLGSNANDHLIVDFISYKQDNTVFSDTLGQVGTWSTSAYLDIAQIQLEEGSVATPFEQRPIGLEFSLCQRYFETSYAYGITIPTIVTSYNFGSTGIFCFEGASATVRSGTIPFITRKRVSPIVRLYSFAGTFGKISVGGYTSSSDISPVAIDASNSQLYVGTGSTSSSTYYGFGWTADAEL